ncbi:MAG: GNAT family N-acetyltransferase, partial [Nocardioides sp.]
MTEPETTPVTPADLRDVLRTMATWQHDGSPVPLHPGDVGWHHRFGTDAVTGSLRTWAVDGRVVALALVDEPQLWRLSLDPAYVDDEGLARRVLAAFPDGPFALECRSAGALTGLLAAAGWEPDEPWTPLVRDLSAPVEAPAMDVAVAGPAHVEDRVAVQRAAFTGSTFSVERWHAMAAGPAYADARCLVGYAA